MDFTSVEVAEFLAAFFVADGANAYDNLNHITLEIKRIVCGVFEDPRGEKF